ncbi:MAG: hypothetical protein EBQ82_00850 [Betaproteobacteria bacterium]|nr:hypothetical protein [Betaproteobacteria bacterium]NBY03961.1 hypothetical protein [Betaproteobacteria bacterium]
MAISWMTALKVVPWGKVLEHAPQVLDKARSLMDKHLAGTTATDTAVKPEAQAGEVPSLGELKNRCIALQAQYEQIRQSQQQMAQTMAELAEQNASLIGVVNRLQSRLRFWSLAVVVLAGGVLALWWVRHAL